ncbi:MAG: divergent polysaccharide deacetylase family protein [Thermodesulforhabdaceae bacterium]
MAQRSSGNQDSSSRKGGKGSPSSKRSGRSKGVSFFKGWFLSLWIFLAAVWIGIIIWSYWESGKKPSKPGQTFQDTVKNHQSGESSKTERQSNKPDVGDVSTDDKNVSTKKPDGGEKTTSTYSSQPAKVSSNNGPANLIAQPDTSRNQSYQDSHKRALGEQNALQEKISRHGPTPESLKEAADHRATSTKKIQGWVSIIIDDMGGNLDIAKKFLELPYPIAFAVLPYEPYSREVSKLIRQHGKVLLLHMPMEPHGYPQKNPGKGALLLGQDRDTQRRLILKALEQVPGAAGVNNHMGSKFTENREAMRSFLEVLKEKNLFFVDSATSDKTVACDVAREVGVVCFRRNVFLDHEPSVSFVNAQFVKLVDMAGSRDATIVIAHPHIVTYELLKKKLAEIQTRNIELVSIDKLGNHTKGVLF